MKEMTLEYYRDTETGLRGGTRTIWVLDAPDDFGIRGSYSQRYKMLNLIQFAQRVRGMRLLPKRILNPHTYRW
jgi:hypothetical protein